MNFNYTEQQRDFIYTADEFQKQYFKGSANLWDQNSIFPKDVIQEAGKMGFCGLYATEEYGGLGLPRLDSAMIFEMLAKGCTTTTAMITIHNMATWIITEFACVEIKKKWGTALTSGQLLASYCLTEPNSGSDAASLMTSAKETDDGYLINGRKSFISGAGETDLLVVMCRTSEDQYQGISAFVIEANTSGITFGKKEEKMGWNAQPTREISFDNVLIDKDQLLGRLGEGFSIAMQALDGGRLNIAACSLGTAHQALLDVKDYIHDRKQFNKPLIDFQNIQFKLAELTTQYMSAKQLLYLAAFKYDMNHNEKTTYCAMAKKWATDIGFTVCDEVLQMYGGYGYIKEYSIERQFRDVRVHKILEGTNEIMNIIIAKNIILNRYYSEIL